MSAKKSLSNRINIYSRTPTIIAAHRMAVKLGIIKAESTDARIETLLAAEIRKAGSKLKENRHLLSPDDAAILNEALLSVSTK